MYLFFIKNKFCSTGLLRWDQIANNLQTESMISQIHKEDPSSSQFLHTVISHGMERLSTYQNNVTNCQKADDVAHWVT